MAERRVEIERRCQLLTQVFIHRLAKFSGVRLNQYVLAEAVEHYFCDIYRLKFFRPVEHADNHKKAAYTMKWLAKIRPIQITAHDARLDRQTLLANDFFAVYCGYALLEIDLPKICQNSEWFVRYTHNLNLSAPFSFARRGFSRLRNERS
ncbi:MAG: hypothetical protein LBP75_07060 [Planctomycetota bacterium]|nr:hypothetical protein [Planctomycetota bacterium]